ncbi:exosortase [Rhodanobacter sp. Root627]|uniref:TIGR03016 family PEP-CTERM system-associated outer membrane protein n=1 Tax=Rhodanobacter sp. Root627 TaxID=1736572 RepID=UPI0006F5A30B|nr:TIGR03016 family PEP-CTERM system-associated outer membrane protein [Rhodanobacter sp. Root627]KRA33142.1 exosortase [Rhodanobacter sp. Root627]
MRALATSAVLSSFVLGGWLTAAAAQGVDVGASNGGDSGPDAQAVGDVPVGVIPQPSAASPGMVMGVTLGELYTDNLTLAPTGEPKQSSWITQVQPFFRGATSGPRFSGALDYEMTGYVYAGRSSSNQLAHDLDANGTLAIVPQHLFVDGMASYGREVINNELSSGAGTFFLDNNRANVATGSLSPYWVQDFGKGGMMLLRYTWGRVLYDDHGISGRNAGMLNGITDSTSNALQFSLTSPEYQTWGWNIGYSDQRIEPDVGQDIEYGVAKLGTSWQISSTVRLLAEGGKESRFLPDGTSRKLGATFWNAGFEWSNTRDNLKMLVGHRFYGRSYDFSWSHTAALLTTSVSYVEQPTDLSQQLLGRSPTQAISLPVNIPVVGSLRNRQVYLMKRATASATYTMPTGNLRLALYNERRTYFTLNDLDEKVTNGDLSWQFDIGPFTTLTPMLGWQRHHFQNGQTSYNHYSQLALVHQVNPKNFGSFRLRKDSRNVYSEVPGAHGYRASAFFVQWTHLL